MSKIEQQASAQPEIKNIKTAWLDVQCVPETGTGIRRLKISLSIRNEGPTVERELHNQYCIDGLVMHSYSLTWLFREKDKELERLREAVREAKAGMDLILDAKTVNGHIDNGIAADACIMFCRWQRKYMGSEDAK